MADNIEQNTETEDVEEVETEEAEDTETEGDGDTTDEDPFAEERTKLKNTATKVRKQLREAEKRAKAAEAALAAKDKPVEENAIDDARREAATTERKKLIGRVVGAKVEAAAKGRFADPTDVERFLDLSEFVDDDGEIDADGIEDALAGLLEKKPHLAAEKKRFQGGGHQGSRAPARPGQISAAELARMSPTEIVKAEKEGRLDSLLGKK
ncbi:hypothetical protein [Leucobacter sp. G161]|uniref:hypothetical protein n=1 Tax=Leucobacter sp. G161 TaxID=663704 RepID=UPI00073B2DF6|nr:hypothetical protein [Leucobacter sp. G161]KUF07183.1 hypothetical protein AUL38_02535 [Leucobacter sp. G161]